MTVTTEDLKAQYDDPWELCAAQQNQIQELEETVQQKDEQIQELEEENEQIHDRMNMQSDLIHDQSDRFDELEETVTGPEYDSEEEAQGAQDIGLVREVNKLGNFVQSALNQTKDNREAIENRDADAFCDEFEGVPDYDLSWAERFHHKGREAVHSYRKRDVHARMLFNALPDRGWKDNKGNIILKTASKLSNRMDLEYSELYRACEALAERSDGKIKFIEDHPKVGKHLRIAPGDTQDVALDLSGVSGPPGRGSEGRHSRTVLAAT